MPYIIMCRAETGVARRADNIKYPSSTEAAEAARAMDHVHRSTWIEEYDTDYSDWDIDDPKYNYLGPEY